MRSCGCPRRERPRNLGVATVTLYRMVDHGSVPAYKISRMIRFELSDLGTYVDPVRVAPAFAARTAHPTGAPVAPRSAKTRSTCPSSPTWLTPTASPATRVR